MAKLSGGAWRLMGILLTGLLIAFLASATWSQAVPVTIATPTIEEARGVHYGRRFNG